jgi:hypothetical protein
LEAWRGRGIGRRLVEAAIDLILQRGGHTAYLFVRRNNAAALHLYESLGFVEVDRTTDLKYVVRPEAALGERPMRVLRRLGSREAGTLYELASQAVGPGRRWLTPVRRRHFVRSADERFFRRIGSLFTGESETTWGVWAGQDRLDDDRLRAGLCLQATRLWNRKPHRLSLWVRPASRGRLEASLAHDVMTLVHRQPIRPVQVSLPACEEAAIRALVDQGFSEVRTLILMKLDL